MAGEIRKGLPRWRTDFWLWLTVSLSLVVLVGWVRLGIFAHHLVPLAYGLPLLLVLINRRRTLMYGMAIAFTVISTAKVLMVAPDHALPGGYPWLSLGMMLCSIWIEAVVLDALVRSLSRMESHAEELTRANEALGASNQALAEREVEISHQNEELQTQSEELQQQNEEFQQQAEELQQQAEEMQAMAEDLRLANEMLRRRELGLESLVDCARHLSSDLREQKTMQAMCRAMVDLVGPPAAGAAVVEQRGKELHLRGHYGFEPANQRDVPLEATLSAIVMRTTRTAALPDVSLRPDLIVPQPEEGRKFGSALAAPLRLNGRVIGAMEVYARSPHEWSAESFKIIEWFAAQAALVLEAMELHAELDRRRGEAVEASVRKTRFLAAVSHDVRTPVNAINLMAEVISRSAESPEFAARVPEMAGELKGNARALADLVTDVLDVARFDSGQIEVASSTFALADFVTAEVRQLRPLAHAKGIDLEVMLPLEPVLVKTDRIKLARVLANLVGNAIKFTETGRVRVEAAVTPTGGAELAVVDTGVGIPAAHLPQIFDEFFQLRNPERDRTKGTGLGLAICKRLALALGCDLNVESTLGMGSRFTIRIPPVLRVQHVPAREGLSVRLADEAPAAVHQGALAGRSILLVEDHHTTRRATAHLLQCEGAVVLTAENGRDALQLLAHESPEILLLDLMLPDLDGAEILRALLGTRKDSLRHIFAVSGDVTPSRLKQVMELGADGLIAKPISIGSLIATLAGASKASEENAVGA